MRSIPDEGGPAGSHASESIRQGKGTVVHGPGKFFQPRGKRFPARKNGNGNYSRLPGYSPLGRAIGSLLDRWHEHLAGQTEQNLNPDFHAWMYSRTLDDDKAMDARQSPLPFVRTTRLLHVMQRPADME